MPLDSAEYMKEVPYTNLYEGILEFKESNPWIITESEEEIINAFLKYEKYLQQWEFFKKDRDEVFLDAINVEKRIKKWLIKSWGAVLITALDWAVNRYREAEKSLWLRRNGFNIAQAILAEEYDLESPTHLQIWPGNGTLPLKLSQENPRWKQVSIWDRLYFTMEDILQDFVKPEQKSNAFYWEFIEKILANILKKAVRERWFNINSVHVEDWGLKEDISFTDLNDIFKELDLLISWNFEEKISDFYSHQSSEIHWSEYFELDQSDVAPLHIAIIILKILFSDPQEQWVKIKMSKSSIIWKIRDDINFLNELKKSDKNNISKSQQWRVRKIIKDIFNEDDSFWITDYNLFLDYIISELEASIKFSERLFDSQSELFQATSFPDLFVELFDEEFVKQIVLEGSEEESIDLNEHANMFFGNFFQGDFLDMPKLIDGKVDIISSTRGDSHLSNPGFQTHVEQSLGKLNPGGLLMSDGIRQSYSNYYRVDEVENALEKTGRDNFHTDYVLWANGEILSLLIQRRHPTGWFLSEEKKYKIYSDNVVFSDKENATKNALFMTTQEVKKWVLDEMEDASQFQSIDVEKMLVAELTRTLLLSEKYDEFREKFSVLRREIISKYEIEDIEKIVNRVLNPLSEDMKKLIVAVKEGKTPDELIASISNENFKDNIEYLYETLEGLIIIDWIEKWVEIDNLYQDTALLEQFKQSSGDYKNALRDRISGEVATELESKTPSEHLVAAMERLSKILTRKIKT
jgi:hypothetical protein